MFSPFSSAFFSTIMSSWVDVCVDLWTAGLSPQIGWWLLRSRSTVGSEVSSIDGSELACRSKCVQTLTDEDIKCDMFMPLMFCF